MTSVADEAQPTVVYIAGLDRSGSTMLASLLEQSDDWIVVGELPTIWEHGYRDDWICGDGVRFSENKFWREVNEDLLRRNPQFSSERARLVSEQIVQRRHTLPWKWLFRGLVKMTETEREYIDNFELLYEAIYSVSGCRTIVDSGKVPFHASLMSRSEKLDFRLVHLIRDPRAVAYSRMRKKQQANASDESRMMAVHTPMRTSLRWIWRNLLVYLSRQQIPKSSSVSYEQLVQSPLATVEDSLRSLSLPALSGNAVEVLRRGEFDSKSNYAFSGNPDRLKITRKKVSLDDEYQTQMSFADYMIVTLLTYPFSLLF